RRFPRPVGDRRRVRLLLAEVTGDDRMLDGLQLDVRGGDLAPSAVSLRFGEVSVVEVWVEGVGFDHVPEGRRREPQPGEQGGPFLLERERAGQPGAGGATPVPRTGAEE